jgi:hypothetical protein
MLMIPELPTFVSPQLHSIPHRPAQLRPSFACAAVNSFSPTLASVINCDHSLPQRLRASYARGGSYSEWIHDSGAGKTVYEPESLSGKLLNYSSSWPCSLCRETRVRVNCYFANRRQPPAPSAVPGAGTAGTPGVVPSAERRVCLEPR